MKFLSFFLTGLFLLTPFLFVSCETLAYDSSQYRTEYSEDTRLSISQVLTRKGPVGYMEEWAIVQDGASRDLYRVYNNEYQERGFILQEGHTYRYETRLNYADLDKNQELHPEYLGQFDLETGVRFVLEEKEPIRLKAPSHKPWAPRKDPTVQKANEAKKETEEAKKEEEE